MAKSIKGREVNMTELAQQNAKAIALGNARMNAKGDLLGAGGKVVKTREEIAREYHTKGSNTVKNVPLSGEINKMLEAPVVIEQEVKPKKKKVEAKVETPNKEPIVE